MMKKALPILRGLGVYLVFLLLPYGLLLTVQIFWPQAAEAALWFLGNFSSLITVVLLLALYKLSGRGVGAAGNRWAGSRDRWGKAGI